MHDIFQLHSSRIFYMLSIDMFIFFFFFNLLKLNDGKWNNTEQISLVKS